MKRYFYLLLSSLIMGCNNNPSQTEKDYIKNLEEKNAALEKELNETKDNSQEKLEESTKRSNEYFTIGSTEDEVLKVMGDPESYDDFRLFKKLQYGMSSVTIENGRVKSYDNSDGNLKVKVKK
jgi:hypothetical protein